MSTAASDNIDQLLEKDGQTDLTGSRFAFRYYHLCLDDMSANSHIKILSKYYILTVTMLLIHFNFGFILYTCIFLLCKCA